MPRKKLIEVALPLTAINEASAKEKSIRHGHPSTLHLWWSRKPLATSRAILFAQLVDDPSAHPERFPTLEDQRRERQRLFDILSDLVQWGRQDDPEVLEAARAAIRDSCQGELPATLDPFCGGGSIPLEAQRLGLRAHGSDLNPVAVLITRGLIEFPQRFIEAPPITREAPGSGTQGLAVDLEAYGARIHTRALARLSHLYPMAAGNQGPAPVVAWLWARTVPCANPACRTTMLLASKWLASTRRGRKIWVEPLSKGIGEPIETRVRDGQGTPPRGTVNRRGARCVSCGEVVALSHLREEARAGRMGQRLIAVVAEEEGERLILDPDEIQIAAPSSADPQWRPTRSLQGKCRVSVPLYGLETFADLFTPRQLQALGTFADLIVELRDEVFAEALAAGLPDDGVRLTQGGQGAAAYADAIVTYLTFALDKCADYWNTLATWMPRGTVSHAFTRQALAMSWDFAEANPLSESHCAWRQALGWVARQVTCAPRGVPQARAWRRDAATASLDDPDDRPIISTDPPYYDNILYADLSDFFYVWLRRVLRPIFPSLFRTALTPREGEIVATHFRHGGDRGEAHDAFKTGLSGAFERMKALHHPDYPMTIYYAFKQTSGRRDGQGGVAVSSTGWEAMLTGLLGSGFMITGTWPVRSERSARSVAQGANAMASSIVLVCRPRPLGATALTRAGFIRALRANLPSAVAALQSGGVQPVDLAQAAIGPGMAIFSRGPRVLEPDGSHMRVRTALETINRVLDEIVSASDEAFEAETAFALVWFESYGHDEGPFGVAETLARARNLTMERLAHHRVVLSASGTVKLRTDGRQPTTTWGALHALQHTLDAEGEQAAAICLGALGHTAHSALALSWRLHAICQARGWSRLALAYNHLAAAWPRITALLPG